MMEFCLLRTKLRNTINFSTMKISLAYIDLEPSIYSEVVWGKQMEK